MGAAANWRIAMDRLQRAGLDPRDMQNWRAVVARAKCLDGPEAARRKSDPGWKAMRGQRQAAARAWDALADALVGLAKVDEKWPERLALHCGLDRDVVSGLPMVAAREAEKWRRLIRKPEGAQTKLLPPYLAEIYVCAERRSGGNANLRDLSVLLGVTLDQMKHARTGKSLRLVPLLVKKDATVGRGTPCVSKAP